MSRTFNMVGGGGGKAVLAITVTNGTATSVTATKSGVSVSLTDSGGAWIAELPSFGTWTVTITDDTHENTATVSATQAGIYTVSVFMPNVPIGYTQLEYIYSHGAVIDTGYKPKSSCKMELRYNLTVPDYYRSVIIRAAGTDNNPFITAIVAVNVSGVQANSFVYYSNQSGYENAIISNKADTNIHTVVMNGASVTIDGTTATISGGTRCTSNSTATMKIYQEGYMNFYYFKMYAPNSSTLVRNMFPAKRNSDDVVGMYDIVNNVFYSSVNTSVFEAGPAV